MHSQENLYEIIDNFIKQVSHEIQIDALYLFGSYVKGKPHDYSDIDLAIFSKSFDGDRFYDRKKINKFILSTSIDLEIHPFNTEEFEREDNPFIQEIVKTGIRIR